MHVCAHTADSVTHLCEARKVFIFTDAIYIITILLITRNVTLLMRNAYSKCKVSYVIAIKFYHSVLIWIPIIIVVSSLAVLP